MVCMASTTEGKAAALSALQHYRRSLGQQGEPLSDDAVDLIVDLLLGFDAEVADHIIRVAAEIFWESEQF